MQVGDVIETRIELREYAEETVDRETRRRVLEAARLAPSGHNSQHWRFVLVDEDQDRLAESSTSGGWVAGADFAVIVLTDPERPYHRIDAGRAITHMQFVAWDAGVGSCIYTGVDEAAMRAEYDIPDEYEVTAVVGFGYPPREIRGDKERRPLAEIAFEGSFGEPFE